MRWVALAALFLAVSTGPGAQGFQEPSADQGRLRADRVRYDAKKKVYTAEGNVRLTLGDMEVRARRARLEQGPQIAYAFGNVLVVQGETALSAEEVKYEIRLRVVHASGGVKVTQKDVTVTAPRLRYDWRAQHLFAEGDVRLEQGRYILTAETLSANLGIKRAEVKGNARLLRGPGGESGDQDKLGSTLAREETTVTAPRMVFRWDVNEAQAEGGVVVTQSDKTARAVRASYSESVGRIELLGEVVVEQLGGEWLVKGGVIEPPKDEQTKRALASKTILMCERLIILLKEHDMRAEGKVVVTQKGRSATGDRATYRDKDKRIVVTGNVLIREEDGSQLRADEVVIFLTEEIFEATGNVDSEVSVKRGK